MKARSCLAGAAALALALVVAVVPAPSRAADPTPAEGRAGDPALTRDLNSPYAHTAVGALIDANGGKIPANGAEMVTALSKLGDFVQLPVPFSAVALDSGLTHPRVVITLRPSTTPPPKSVFVPDKPGTKPAKPSFGGWGGGPSGKTVLVPQPPEPLNQLATTRTQLQGRLFLAANTEIDSGKLKVRTVEFISWNCRKLKFDFGVIEGMGTDKPELKILDGVRCFSCHKNRGPILGVSPWSNTAHNTVVQKTATEAISNAAERIGFATARSAIDGVNLFDPHGPEVDAAVRIGGDLLRDRAIFKEFADSPDGRRALVFLFETVVVRGSLEKLDKDIAHTLNAMPLARFGRNATTVKLNAPPSTLRDFSPAGPVVREVATFVGPGQTKNQVTLCDEARAHGRPRLPSEFVPSNPKAFVPVQAKNPLHVTEVISAVMLAQTIGLTEKDRAFLADAIDETVKRAKTPGVNRVSVTSAVFNGPAFADVLKTGVLPDRDDFKDRVVAGLVAVLRNHKAGDEFWASRDTYTSAPKFDPNAKPEKDAEALPSHACLRCHEIQRVGKRVFNPIPDLAFDPFDATARDAWLKTADRKRKAEVLGRLAARIGTDKDMPPVDSTEHELYRVKDPAALNAVKNWLDAELKKVK